MNTVNQNVINFLESIGCGTFGTTLFFGRVPQSTKTPTELWWVAPVTSKVSRSNVTGEDVVLYDYQLFYRSTSLKQVDSEIFKALKNISNAKCANLSNYETVQIICGSSNIDLIVDSENRAVGSLAFAVKVYNPSGFGENEE